MTLRAPWVKNHWFKGKVIPGAYNVSGSLAKGVYFCFFSSVSNSSVFSVRFFRTTAVCSKYLPSAPYLLGNGVLMEKEQLSLIEEKIYGLCVISFFFCSFSRG